MKTKIASFVVLALVAATFAVAQDGVVGAGPVRTASPLVTPLENLTEGAAGVPGNSTDWEGWSEIDYIPGAALFGLNATDSYFTIGFSAGSTVNITSMVVYTTVRANNIVTKVTKLNYLGKANPSINLTSTTNCPNQPVSASNPCFIKLTKAAVEMEASNDYYFAIYFTSDSENNSMRGAGGSNQSGALSGWQIDGDDGLIPVGGTIPVGDQGYAPLFLMYLTNE
jgi:hypothetical protein